MKESSEILAKIRFFAGVKTDKELSEKFDINYGTLDSWKNRNKIPAKRLLEFSKKLGVSMDILVSGDIKGGNNVIFKGDGNVINQRPSVAPDEIASEFLELYALYRTPKIESELLNLLDKLKKIKEADA